MHEACTHLTRHAATSLVGREHRDRAGLGVDVPRQQRQDRLADAAAADHDDPPVQPGGFEVCRSRHVGEVLSHQSGEPP